MTNNNNNNSTHLDHNPEPVHIGYAFHRLEQYTDSKDKYIHEVWVIFANNKENQQ